MVDYHREVSTPTSYLTTFKIHVNSVIYNMIYRYMYMDVRYFYLNITMRRAEHFRIHTSMIPKEFVNAYNLWYKFYSGYIFVRVTKLMYELP